MLSAPPFTRPRRRTVLFVAAAALVALALSLAWYLASPLFLTRAVSELSPATAVRTSLATGQFGVVDAIHKGEGTVSIVRLGDGQLVLRLDDDFRVTNGPDLYVYLSGATAPRSSGELHAAGAFEVAQLKGNVGGQNYGLPAELDPSKFHAVVIYCRRFATVFSTAELDS
jgi:Electron transfer DM13